MLWKGEWKLHRGSPTVRRSPKLSHRLIRQLNIKDQMKKHLVQEASGFFDLSAKGD
jgi:hypothetical protein